MWEKGNTYRAAEALLVPLRPQRLDDGVGDGLLALAALCGVAVCVAVDAPSVSVLLHKRGLGVKWLWFLRQRIVLAFMVQSGWRGSGEE